MKRMGTVGLLLTALLFVRAAEAALEEGAASHTPWSGYWWPIGKGELLIPLGKYDYLAGTAAAAWERQTHPPGPSVPEWHGYCHAWAASAVLESEPNKPRRVSGPSGSGTITLGIGDQKGLLAASHSHDVANNYGDRFGDGEGNEDYQDMDPCTLWQILRTFLKEQKVPLVMDLEAGPEVWNYPVFAYRVEYSPAGPSGEQRARLALWAADDAVPPDHVGVSLHYQTYTFTFQLRGGSIVMGSGRWVGQSVENHPDFAWYPYVVVPENPYVDYNKVKQLVAVPASSATSGAGTPPGSSAASGSTNRPGGGSGTGSGLRPNVVPNATPGVRPNVLADTSPGSTPGVVPGIPPGSFGPSSGSGGALLPQGGTCLSPLELVATIAEKTSSFGLDVTVDRFDGGQYAVGEPLQVRGSSQQAGYLYLFYIDSQGEPALLYPRPGQDNRIAAQQPFVVPRPESGAFRVKAPLGVHRIKAVVTSRPLVMTGLVSPVQSQQQAQRPGLQGGYQMSRFRWYPSQQRQVQILLKQYQKRQKLTPKDLDGIKVPALFESFAQDEVAFYVGPGEN